MATTLPVSISATRSQSRSASSMKWVTRTIVTPRARTPSISSQVSRRACGSRPVVSSSSTATRGDPSRASAIESRCFWPPDSLPNGVLLLAFQPQHVHQGVPVGRVPVERAVVPERLGYPQLVGQLAVLQLNAEALGQFGPVAAGIESENADPAGIGRPQALDAFDGRGLARAVRAEDPEDLALLHGEGDIVDRHGVPVRLVQVLHLDHCRHAPRPPVFPGSFSIVAGGTGHIG